MAQLGPLMSVDDNSVDRLVAGAAGGRGLGRPSSASVITRHQHARHQGADPVRCRGNARVFLVLEAMLTLNG